MATGNRRAFAVCALLCVRLAGAASGPGDPWAPEVVLTPQQGHAGPAATMAFCPDGRLLVTGGLDGAARLWEVSSGREVRTFVGSLLPVRSVACSPAGDFIATASEDGTARVWDLATGKERLRLAPGEGALTSIAIAPDGRALLSGSQNGWIRVWDLASGKELRSWRAHLIQIPSLSISPDGAQVASASFDTSVRLWDVRTGEKLRQWNKHGWLVTSVQFSPDGKSLLSAGLDKTARLYSLETGAEIRRFGDAFSIHAARFSADGSRIIAVGEVPGRGGENDPDGTARVWETATGKEVFRFTTEQEQLVSVAVSPSEALAASGGFRGGVRLWDLGTGKERRFFGALAVRPLAAAASPDGRLLLAGETLEDLQLWDLALGQPRPCFAEARGERTLLRSASFLDPETVLVVGEWRIDLWSLRTCTRLRSVGKYSKSFVAAALSRDRRLLVTGNADGTATVWDVERDEPLRELKGHDRAVLSIALSPDSRRILTGGEDGTARMWSRDTGEELRRIELARAVTAVDFSPDGALALTATANVPAIEVRLVSTLLRFNRQAFDELTERGGEVRLWAVESWQEVFRKALYPVTAAAFSSDGRSLLVGADDGTAHLLEAPSGRELGRFLSGAHGMTAVGFLGEGGRVLTASLDGFLRLWDGRSGRELARLTSFFGKDWAVVTPDGRFDTNNPGDLEGLSWVVSDDPETPLPVDVFLREYYEPRLLARTLRGESFPPLPSIANLNRVQPEVRIVGVEDEEGGGPRVRVTIEVSGREKSFQRGGKTVIERSGAKEVRLFRDGRLVGIYPPPGEPWRLEPPTATSIVTFRDIWLPTGTAGVELAAYAFNSDGVKSETARRLHRAEPLSAKAAPRAYLIHIGINKFDDASLDLRFAVNDARALRDTLIKAMPASGRFVEIVPISLISGSEPGNATGRQDARPTKARIAAVLKVLGGQKVDPSLLAGISGAERLKAARPEDLVLLTWSTHGETDGRGQYYLIPADSGNRKGAFFDPHRLISADELSQWLQGIDAGEMVMIVDACRSAASVASPELKPGPMDSHSLGQLAYDKKMRVLAATQVADVALENDRLQHGFLTYALVREGIEAEEADNDKDGEITLDEWLQFAEKRVPALYADVAAGRPIRRGVEALADPMRLPEESRLGQRPVLFDFSLKTEGDDPIVVARTHRSPSHSQ